VGATPGLRRRRLTFAGARISRSGNVSTIVSGGGADHISNAGTSPSLVTYYAQEITLTR
jgi:hypothetical protein